VAGTKNSVGGTALIQVKANFGSGARWRSKCLKLHIPNARLTKQNDLFTLLWGSRRYTKMARETSIKNTIILINMLAYNPNNSGLIISVFSFILDYIYNIKTLVVKLIA
jgi:hypothetical protein